MNLRRLLNWLVPGPRVMGQPDPEFTYGDSVRALLRQRYPGTEYHRLDGHLSYWAYPYLPRGALSRVAEEVGCSRGYAAAVARKMGYYQEPRVD